jgi:hypothetical protein
LRFLKAFCCFGPHENRSVPFKTSKNGKLHSADLEMNLFSEASLPVSCCIDFLDVGGCICKIASIFVGFASMPLADTKHPKNFPFSTPKMLFSWFSFRHALLKFLKVSCKSDM